jgi:uncharacterized Zn-finger protein
MKYIKSIILEINKSLNKISFYLNSFTYPSNKEYDEILVSCITHGIDYKSSALSEYEGFVKFNNGVEFLFWNANKFYAWLSKGNFLFDGGIFRFKDMRPKKKTIFNFHELVKDLKRVEYDIFCKKYEKPFFSDHQIVKVEKDGTVICSYCEGTGKINWVDNILVKEKNKK